jgi:hypothetical protein
LRVPDTPEPVSRKNERRGFTGGTRRRAAGHALCLSLLSNAVVLWNTLQIERIVTELRASATTIRDEDLGHVWPLQRHHITPNGVYFANRAMPAVVLPDPVEA